MRQSSWDTRYTLWHKHPIWRMKPIYLLDSMSFAIFVRWRTAANRSIWFSEMGPPGQYVCEGGRLVRRVVTVNLVPKAEASPKLMKELGLEEDKPKEPKLMILELQACLMEILEKNGDLTMLEDWPEEDAKRAWWLHMEYHSIFSLDKNEMGCTNATKHVIKLTKSEPFKERFRCIAPPLIEEVREHIQEMLNGGAICPSNSTWCNAVVLVRKKDGTLQFCIDFWWLNDRMEKDSYPMLKMIDTMEMMLGSKFFSMMDLKSSFWQVKMAEDSWPYTAFTVSSLGVYEFLRMLFGLCNGPVTFQHLMHNCLGELNLTYTLIYLNDIILRRSTIHQSWNSWLWNGPLWISFENTCSTSHSMSGQITTPSPVSCCHLILTPWVIGGWQLWPISTCL